MQAYVASVKRHLASLTQAEANGTAMVDAASSNERAATGQNEVLDLWSVVTEGFDAEVNSVLAAARLRRLKAAAAESAQTQSDQRVDEGRSASQRAVRAEIAALQKIIADLEAPDAIPEEVKRQIAEREAAQYRQDMLAASLQRRSAAIANLRKNGENQELKSTIHFTTTKHADEIEKGREAARAAIEAEEAYLEMRRNLRDEVLTTVFGEDWNDSYIPTDFGKLPETPTNLASYAFLLDPNLSLDELIAAMQTEQQLVSEPSDANGGKSLTISSSENVSDVPILWETLQAQVEWERGKIAHDAALAVQHQLKVAERRRRRQKKLKSKTPSFRHSRTPLESPLSSPARSETLSPSASVSLTVTPQHISPTDASPTPPILEQSFDVPELTVTAAPKREAFQDAWKVQLLSELSELEKAQQAYDTNRSATSSKKCVISPSLLPPLRATPTNPIASTTPIIERYTPGDILSVRPGVLSAVPVPSMPNFLTERSQSILPAIVQNTNPSVVDSQDAPVVTTVETPRRQHYNALLRAAKEQRAQREQMINRLKLEQ